MKERRSFSCVVGVSPVACGVRAARCQSRRVLGVSRVVRSHRVVRSLASSRRLSSRVVCRRVVRSLESSRRLSSRVVCRLAVRRPAAPSVSRVVCGVVSVSVVSRRASSRCSASVASCAESCRSVSLRCAQSPRRQESRVIRSSVVLRRVCHLVVRRPAAGVSRVVRSACESRPFFLSFQTRWMTFFFVLY